MTPLSARTPATGLPPITDQELADIDRANETGQQPVVFIHGLWLMPSSWDRWRVLFEDAGFSALSPGWPDDPDTVAKANADPEALAGKGIGDVADHYEAILRVLERWPAIIGHSFGGLIAQILAGRGLSAATVAIDPAPFQGVLPLPLSALKAAWPVLEHPGNRDRAIPLTYEQFRFAFANAVSEEEAKDLYDRYVVPASGKPIFQAAAANINPWTEAKVDTRNPHRGPLLIISGEKDNTVPYAVAQAAYRLQKHNEGVTELLTVPNRGHALTIDHGWREVADLALRFIARHVTHG